MCASNRVSSLTNYVLLCVCEKIKYLRAHQVFFVALRLCVAYFSLTVWRMTNGVLIFINLIVSFNSFTNNQNDSVVWNWIFISHMCNKMHFRVISFCFSTFFSMCRKTMILTKEFDTIKLSWVCKLSQRVINWERKEKTKKYVHKKWIHSTCIRRKSKNPYYLIIVSKLRRNKVEKRKVSLSFIVLQLRLCI